MNFESGFTTQGSALDIADEADGRRRRQRRILIVSVIGAALIIAAMLFFRSGGTEKAAAPGAGRQAPLVTVTAPGRQDVQRSITAPGSIAARVDMPVGVAGEGGQVTRVFVEPGTWVKAGQVLAAVDRQVQAQQIASLDAQIRVAQADSRLAQANLDRAQQLVARGFISKADIDRLTATRDAAVARVRVAQATSSQARASAGRLDIRAPADGLVLTRDVEPGQIVSPGSGALFRLARGGELEVLARFSEADLARMTPGLAATVQPVGADRSFTGRVWQVAPVVDPQTRQGIVRIALPYDRALRPGGFATARVNAGSVTATLLPESAVHSDDKGSYVMVATKDNRVTRRRVRVGDVSERGVTVLEGLSGNELVVMTAGAFLNEGDRIQPKREVRRG